MKLLFKQRIFSWFDSYDIYGETGDTLFTVKGKASWGHKLYIFNGGGEHIATLKERVVSFLPCFDMYIGDKCIGSIKKDLSLFKPSFSVNCNGWSVKGSFFEWDYKIVGSHGRNIAVISKEIFNFRDTYVIEVADEKDALEALMVTLAIDAEKCSRNDGSGININMGK